MIDISNISATGDGLTFDLEVNGQTLTGCRAGMVRSRLEAILPASAARLRWGDDTIETVNAALRVKYDQDFGWS